MKFSSQNQTAGHARVVAVRGIDYRVPVLAKIEGVEKKTRVLSVASYLGLGPFLWFSGVTHQQNRVLKHHAIHGLGFAFLLLVAAILYEITYLSGYIFIVHIWKPSPEEYFAAARTYGVATMTGELVALLVVAYCGLTWVINVAGAWRGRTPGIPILSSLFSRIPVVQIGVYWSLFLEVLILIFVGMGIRSVQIARQTSPRDAKVYVLYTVGGYIPFPGLFENFTPPRWFMTLGFYPLVHAGMEKYGENGVAVLPLTEDTFAEATRQAKFIFIASHGGSAPGSFSLSVSPHLQYMPSDVDLSQVGEDLQFVYFSGCFTGRLEAEWKRVLGVDDAILFDRLSAVDEHMMWVWFKSPSVIKSLN